MGSRFPRITPIGTVDRNCDSTPPSPGVVAADTVHPGAREHLPLGGSQVQRPGKSTSTVTTLGALCPFSSSDRYQR